MSDTLQAALRALRDRYANDPVWQVKELKAGERVVADLDALLAKFPDAPAPGLVAALKRAIDNIESRHDRRAWTRAEVSSLLSALLLAHPAGDAAQRRKDFMAGANWGSNNDFGSDAEFETKSRAELRRRFPEQAREGEGK